MEIKIENTFRNDFLQAMYEVRRAFLKNNLMPPKEIGFAERDMFVKILRELKYSDYSYTAVDFGREKIVVSGIKIKIVE